MKWITLLFAGLLSIAVYTGIKTVYYAHEQATLVTKVQDLKKEKDQINASWTQLLLEEKTLSNSAVIDHAVANGMELHVPKAKQVVFLD